MVQTHPGTLCILYEPLTAKVDFWIDGSQLLTNCIGALHGRSIASCVASRTGRTGRTGIEPGDAALPSSFLLGLQLLIEIHLEISVRQRIPRLQLAVKVRLQELLPDLLIKRDPLLWRFLHSPLT